MQFIYFILLLSFNRTQGISDIACIVRARKKCVRWTTDRRYLGTIYNAHQKKRATVDFQVRETNSDFFWRRDGS